MHATRQHGRSVGVRWRLLGPALAGALLGLVAVGTASAAPSCSTSAGTTTCTFAPTGTEDSFTVPAGVGSVHVVAVGGRGADGEVGGGVGGLGTRVSADLAVTPGQTLYVEVAGDGTDGGGFNGGGDGGSPTCGSGGDGGGGGGASDVRTLPMSAGGSLDSRLLVAAGGGGGGAGKAAPCALGNAPGGAGGNADAPGSTAGGGGGGAGTASAGGAGGVAENMVGTGEPGEFGAGGDGQDDGCCGGGGGGGGYYGGGGGGNAGGAVDGGGGGGGGSSLVPAGGTVAVSDASPSVVITYTPAAPVPQPDPTPTPPADPPQEPTPPRAEPAIAQLQLASRCARPTQSGRVRVRLSLLLARPGPVQVRIDRAVRTKVRRSCPRPNSGSRFTGRFRRVAILRRVPTQPAAAAAAVGRRLTLNLRLTPGLYRFTVRAHLDGNRLSRPARRFLRVLG